MQYYELLNNGNYHHSSIIFYFFHSCNSLIDLVQNLINLTRVIKTTNSRLRLLETEEAWAY